MAVVLKEENEHAVELSEHEGNERTDDQLLILNEIAEIWTASEQRFHSGFKKLNRKK